MGLFVLIKQDFNIARLDQSVEKNSVVRVKAETFRRIFAPIKQVMENDPFYRGSEISIADQVRELRRVCQEVQAAHITHDPKVKADRSRLLNALQGVLESVEEGAYA